MNRFVTLFLFLIAGQACFAQKSAALQDLQKAVPSQFRHAFCSVLKNGIVAQEKQDWATLYELLLPENRGGWSLEKFVKSKGDRPFLLLDFRMTELQALTMPQTDNQNGSWIVTGCALIRDNGTDRTSVSGTTVYIKNGSWYTDSVGIVARLDSPRASPQCSLKRAAKLQDLCLN